MKKLVSLSVNYHPYDGVISVLSVNYQPSGRVNSIKSQSQLCIPSAENNFPPVAYAPAEGTYYAAANFNLSYFLQILWGKNQNVDISIEAHTF